MRGMSTENRSGKRRRRSDSSADHASEQQQGTSGSSSSIQGNAIPIPVSVGKPSLRRRLEDYYSLIAPDVTANEVQWRTKFELIWDKYGGSAEKELTLARKLAKKYGDVIRLRLTSSANSNDENAKQKGARLQQEYKKYLRSEDWYAPSSSQSNSGTVDFLSVNFDPFAALSASSTRVFHVNGFAEHAPLLDNIDKFRTFLPTCDPLRREPIHRTNRLSATAVTASKCVGDSSKTEQMKKKIPVFTAMAAQYENSGPLSLLHSIHIEREKVKIMIRYVDCIRGTLTGYLIAFDKHMNMLLRDVDEVYTSRVTKIFEGMGLSKGELEHERRKACISAKGSTGVNHRKKGERNGKEISLASDSCIKVGYRHLPQLLVRGDNVVSVQRL